MNTWYFWKEYQKAIDRVSAKKIKEKVRNEADVQRLADLKLNRESSRDKLSRFLCGVKRMPKAWGGKEWTMKQLRQANQLTVENDMFRRRLKRELGLR